jgi:uncharacterized membrane protein YjfL (UPF0719 family)
MNKIGILALIEIFSALSSGVFLLFITYKGLKYLALKRYGIEKNNLAYSLFTAGVLLCVGIMMSGVIDPLLSTFRIISEQHKSFASVVISFLWQGGLYIAIAYSCSIVIVVIGVSVYANLTPIDEFKEIKNNNIGVAVIVCVIILSLTLMSREGVTLLIESIVPYPELSPR